MPSPSCPSPVIDQSHPQSNLHENALLADPIEPDSDEEEEEEEEEEYAARLYLPVTHGKGTFRGYSFSVFFLTLTLVDGGVKSAITISFQLRRGTMFRSCHF